MLSNDTTQYYQNKLAFPIEWMQLPVQQLPIFSSPAVFKLLRVHPTNFIKIRFINSKQAKAIHFPKACVWKSEILDKCTATGEISQSLKTLF